MHDEPYELPKFPPKLDWFQTYRGTNKAGEILASFELLQVGSINLRTNNISVFSILYLTFY